MDRYRDDEIPYNLFGAGLMATTPQTTCPRCGELYPEIAAAVSRWDNETKICSSCGTEEALLGFDARSADVIHPVTGHRRWVTFTDANV